MPIPNTYFPSSFQAHFAGLDATPLDISTVVAHQGDDWIDNRHEAEPKPSLISNGTEKLSPATAVAEDDTISGINRSHILVAQAVPSRVRPYLNGYHQLPQAERPMLWQWALLRPSIPSKAFVLECQNHYINDLSRPPAYSTIVFIPSESSGHAHRRSLARQWAFPVFMADSLPVSEPYPMSQPAVSSQTQPVRIHFPDRFLTTRTHGDSSRSSSVSFTSPAQPMLQSWSHSRTPAETTEGRRRVHSLGPDPLVSGGKSSKNTPPRLHGSRRKNPTPNQTSVLSPLKVDSFMSDFEPSAFSDEYDLSHEDPKILQDVHRALHLQSRRRERMSQLQPTSDEVPSLTSTPMNMSTSYPSTSTAPPAPHSSPQYLQVANLPSEVDFSPSTRSVPPHPVPLSSNGGATLDWTGSHSEEDKLDRRWTISRSKRKAKERILPSSKPIVEKQEALFTDRISRIRAEASPPTVRKAAIVGEQLGRRYNILYASLASGDPVGLAEITRWYAGLGTETRAWLDDAEPLTWLKHLWDRHGRRRSQWHVSALIVEEYIKFKRGTASCTSPPQSLAASSFETPSFQSRLKSAAKRISAPPSDSSPGTSLGRIRSLDGHVSFGPLVASSHDSPGNTQTRGEGETQGWRHSIPAFDIPSPYHDRNASGGLSPASSRLNIIHHLHRPPAESEEGSSSPFGSQSEDQNDSAPSGPYKKSRRKDRSQPNQLRLPKETATLADVPDVHVPDSLPANPMSSPAFPSRSDREIIAFADGAHPGATLSQPGPLQCKRSYRSTSLPVTPNVHQILPKSKGDSSERDQIEMEYELRLRTLEELKSHNHRLRHRMQRVAVDVREYELVCSSVMPSLGIGYRSLPTELLDALSHDPSAVTSGTRKRQGWRVVEDIHARVLRQREILTNFLSGAKADVDAISIPENFLDNPISTLMEKLQALERAREPLQEQADELSLLSTEVRASHSTIKEEYNDALSYTSVVYPELSHIVALEESYRDQYQQIWELGMDALTVILDTIAPFWRSYGKIIGEDMQDFIIIPWYRNEFSGESKRYPIESVPHRSLRHWIALFSLGALTFFITFFQARAAITSAWHYRLLCIENQTFRWTIMPFFWVVILIEWVALVFEICVVLLHISVIAWWLGWFVGICT